MTEQTSAAVLTGVGEGVRAYLRMGAGLDEAVVAQAAGAACGCARAFLGADLAAEWDDVPAAVAQGLVLLAAQIVEHREADAMPLGIVATLWRPFRVMRLRPLRQAQGGEEPVA